MQTVEYYLMRHTSYYDRVNEFVDYKGFITLQISVERLMLELKEKFPKRNLRIIHSVLPRAKQTSLLIVEMLKDIKTFCRNDPRLNSDKLQIDDDYIEEVVRACQKDNEVCLILSHQPDIEHFCKKKLQTSEYIRRSVDLEEEEKPPSNDNDDLPF